MEQLNDILLDFNAFAKKGEDIRVPFSLLVTGPAFDEGRGHYCTLVCPYFREKPFLIFGADEAQACELAIDFIRQLLEGQAVLVDGDGNHVT